MNSRLLGVLYACAGSIAFSAPSAEAVLPSELTPYAVDMHLHGHSNHNAGAHPASMEYHSVQAVLTGYADVLWWSDHTRMFDQWRPFSFDTGPARIDEATLDITGLYSQGTAAATHLAAKLTGGTPSVSMESGAALIQLQADAGVSEFQFLSYEARNALSKVAGYGFNRPLTSQPIADVELECDSPGAAAVCEVEFELAWHHEGDQPVPQTITYRIDSQVAERRARLVTPSQVQVVVPLQTGGHYLFDLLQDASLMENGDDNTIGRFIVRVGAHSGVRASMTFRGLTITSEQPTDLHQIEAVQGLAQRYEGLFGLEEPVGLEFGTAQGHVNGFLPRPMDYRDLDLFDVVQGARTNLSVKDWTTRVHERGGLASLNHPFGPGTDCGTRPAAQCVAETAQTLLAEGAYGTDLLEVGYVNRGLPLQDHLDLWDILTANELLLYGTGTSDNHGSPWAKLRTYVSWVLSPSSEPEDLLNSLRVGRVFFGNPKVWDGTFSFQVGDANMGDRIPNPGGTSLVQFQLDPWPDSVEVYLVQGLLKPGLQVEYLHNRTPLVRGQAMLIDMSRPSFVRLEAYEELGDAEKLALFTNPVTMLPSSASVSGTVFEDLNSDGVLNQGEPPISGARLILRSPGPNGRFEAGGDDVFTNRWTDESGTYLFTGLPPGSHRLNSVKEANSSVPNDALLTSGAQTYSFNLTGSDNLVTHDFGYLYPNDGSVSGLVFQDLNSDGVLNQGEPPISGARLILRSPGPNGRFEAGGDDVFTNRWTDESGTYVFTGLLPGSYRVTSIKGANSSILTDAVLTSGVKTYNFALTRGENLFARDFGYVYP